MTTTTRCAVTSLVCAAMFALLLTACSSDNRTQTPTAPATPAAAATYNLTGSVTERASGTAIAGATVVIADGPNAGKSTTTSQSGAYTLSTLQQSDFTVNVSAQNYVTLSTKVSLAANQTQAFALEPKPKDAAVTPVSCSYELSVARTIDGYPNGSTFTVGVTTGAGCAWTVSTDSASWIHLQGAASGTGTGSFTFATDANNSAATRSGTVTCADKIITLNQTPNLVVTVTGDTPRLGGPAVPFSAVARLGDGSTTVVTTQATWDSSAPSVATVTAAGFVQAVSAGTADIRATYRGITGSVRISVPVAFLHNTLVGPGATNYPGGYAPDEIRGWGGYYAVADDFTAAFTTRITVIAWQGIYCRTYYPDLKINPVPDATEFRLGIYSDNGGRATISLIGPEYHFDRSATNERLEANVPGSCTGGPNDGISGLYNYEVTLPSPVSVTAGTRYWLRIRAYYAAASESMLTWLWRFGATDNGVSDPDIAGAIGRDLAFSVR